MTLLKQQLLDQALLISAKANNFAELQRYFAEGAALTAKGEDGRSALIWAAEHGNAAMVEFLLKNGSAKEQHDEKGNTALIIAILAGHENLVPLFLQYGCDPNGKNSVTGATPLMAATIEGCDRAVGYLMQAPNIDLNLKDKFKTTAIAYAVCFDRKKLLSDFIEAKADMRLSDNQQRGLVDLARDFGHMKLVPYLESALQTRLSADNRTQLKHKKPHPVKWV